MSDLGSSAWRTVRQSRFLTQDPEQLWSMVEGADGATATELGVLLTQAAKTIGEIGTDLRTHSMAVEWEGKGGEAFRKWIHQAALATLGLGDYSASAGKWLGHAGDTLHEVRPQLEILRNQSATARSVLDAHAAKATDIGDHDGSPSDAAVEKAKTSFADDSAEAAGLMIKLAQSYTASTEQIDALKAPEFPELPKRFVPIERDGGTHITAPTADGGTQGTVARADALGRETDADSGVGGMSSAPRASAPHHLTDLAVGPDAPPRPHTDTTNTAIDSVRTVPSAPAAPSAPPAPPPEPSSPDGRTQPTTGLLPPAFGGRAVTPQVPRAGGGHSVYGGRSALPTPSGSGTPGGSHVPGRGPTGPFGPGMSGGQPVPGRESAVPGAARNANGVTGGRPVSPPSGRSAGAIPRGTVIGGTPQQQPPIGRGTAPGGSGLGATTPRANGRTANPESASKSAPLPAQSDGIVGGQPRTSRQRGRAGFTSGGAGLVRGTGTDDVLPQSGGTARGASAVTRAPYGGDRSAHDERSRSRTNQRAEDEEGRPTTPRPPSGPDRHAGQEG